MASSPFIPATVTHSQPHPCNRCTPWLRRSGLQSIQEINHLPLSLCHFLLVLPSYSISTTSFYLLYILCFISCLTVLEHHFFSSWVTPSFSPCLFLSFRHMYTHRCTHATSGKHCHSPPLINDNSQISGVKKIDISYFWSGYVELKTHVVSFFLLENVFFMLCVCVFEHSGRTVIL